MFGAGADGKFCFSCSSGRERISLGQTQVKGCRQWYLYPRQKPLISVLLCQALTKESNINDNLTYLPLACDMCL